MTVPFTRGVEDVVDLQPLRQQIDHLGQEALGMMKAPLSVSRGASGGGSGLRLGGGLRSRLRRLLRGWLSRRLSCRSCSRLLPACCGVAGFGTTGLAPPPGGPEARTRGEEQAVPTSTTAGCEHLPGSTG